MLREWQAPSVLCENDSTLLQWSLGTGRDGAAGLLGLTFNVWLWFLHLQIGYTDWDGRDLGGPSPPRVLPLWGPSKLVSSMACPSPTADLRRWSTLHGHHVHLVWPGLSYLSELCSQLARRSLPCPRGSGLHVRGWERRLEYEADPSPCPRPLPPAVQGGGQAS